MTSTTASIALVLTCVALSACGGSQGAPETPSDTPAAEPAVEGPADPAPARASITAEACEANGGTVVGDIGDGAIHKPDYRCPSGAAPTGNIRAPEGGPVAIEGSVCCPK